MKENPYMDIHFLGIILNGYIIQIIVSTVTTDCSVANNILTTPDAGIIPSIINNKLALFAYSDPNNIVKIPLENSHFSPNNMTTMTTDIYDYNSLRFIATNTLTPQFPLAILTRSNNVVFTNMESNYVQKISQKFPNDFNTAIKNAERKLLPETNYWHGEGFYVQNVINATTSILEHIYVYMFFNYYPNGNYEDSESVVVTFELTINPQYNPTLTFKDYKFMKNTPA
jgi:hypothetical protein